MTAMKISTALSLVLGLAAVPALAAPTDAAKGAAKSDMGAIGEKCELGFAAADINNDGKISWREARSHQGDVFGAADSDHDGFLTRSEFRECMKASADAGGKAGADKAAAGEAGDRRAEQFAALDADKDKRITRSEYMGAGQKAWGEAAASSGDGMSPEDYSTAMGDYSYDPDAADLDQDDTISESEAAIDVSRRFASMDVDRDDVIDETEWRQGEPGRNTARLFEWMDLNNDGQISMEESALASMRSFDTATADEPQAVPVWVFRSYYVR